MRFLNMILAVLMSIFNRPTNTDRVLNPKRQATPRNATRRETSLRPARNTKIPRRFRTSVNPNWLKLSLIAQR